jgi:hypothetical protein
VSRSHPGRCSPLEFVLFAFQEFWSVSARLNQTLILVFTEKRGKEERMKRVPILFFPKKLCNSKFTIGVLPRIFKNTENILK